MSKTVISADIYGKQYEVDINELKWRPAAYGIVIKENKVLLSPQFGDNSYDLPGGGVDLGESPEAAVVREIKEETGLDAANPRLIDAQSSFFTFKYEGHNLHKQCVMLYYVCELVGGEISDAGFDEHEKEYARLAEWLPISKLDSIKVASSVDWRDLVIKAYENFRN